MEYLCNDCKYTTNKKSSYEKHLLTKKHLVNSENKKEKFICKECNYETLKKNNYDRHLSSHRHMTLLNTNKEKENAEVKQKLELLMKKMETLEQKNDQNTNKIVKEARNVRKSVLSLLNTHFKDTPSIEYIKQEPFFKELEEEYKAKINDGTDKIFMRIFTDYEKKKLVKTLSDLIIKFVKKENQHFQPVFNIDCARANFATKIDDFWLNDKKGLQLRKFTVDKVVDYMIDVLEVFRLRLVSMRKENIIKSTIERSDYLMKNQSLLFDVVSFLNNPNTHMKIVCELSPNLRCNEKLIELYIT